MPQQIVIGHKVAAFATVFKYNYKNENQLNSILHRQHDFTAKQV